MKVVEHHHKRVKCGTTASAAAVRASEQDLRSSAAVAAENRHSNQYYQYHSIEGDGGERCGKRHDRASRRSDTIASDYSLRIESVV